MSTIQESSIASKTEDAQSSNTEADPSKDEVFHILSNKRRRYTLHCLMQREGSVTKREVSRQVAAWENEVQIEDVTPDMRKRVYISLHQTHIPKMRENGLLEPEGQGSELALTDDIQEFQVYLDIVEDEEIPWNKFYLGLAVISGSLVGLAALGVTPFDAVPEILLAAFTAGSLTVASVLHVLESKRYQLGSGQAPPELQEDADPVEQSKAVLRRLRASLRERVDSPVDG